MYMPTANDYRMVRKWTTAMDEAMGEGTLDPRTVADMCLAYMSEDDVKAMCAANDLESLIPDEDDDVNPIKDAYVGGICPDCGTEIPDDVSEGDSCSNCEHVFTESSTPNDPMDDVNYVGHPSHY